MGYLRSRLGIGKPVMGYALGVFHLFLATSFLHDSGADDLAFGTGLLLLVVGSAMLLWGFYHHRELRAPWAERT